MSQILSKILCAGRDTYPSWSFDKNNFLYFSVTQTEETERMRNSLGKLSSLVGAMKIHEALIDEELVVKKKNQPTDAFYKAVLIRESRRNLAVENDSDSEYDDIVESEY